LIRPPDIRPRPVVRRIHVIIKHTLALDTHVPRRFNGYRKRILAVVTGVLNPYVIANHYVVVLAQRELQHG
jgi:hypothetical protein